ncbi:MAG TPA: HEAT repeat domain-containing protein, partial [Deferrisomatales bacterium]|nr:HEAT repeat domain-containing protein [Deferrisomatales bacterium]
LQESPFMGSEYSATLEHVAAAQLQGQVRGVDLTADLEPHLDAVVVGLALHDATGWGTRSQERLAQRIDHADPGALLDLAEELDRGEPALLGTRPDLCERLFHHCSRQVRALEDEQRRALVRFAQRHEEALLDSLFRALLLEEQIAVRRFLVDVVAAFSPATTPSVVSRLRSSPWYVTRNLTIAMGRRREPTTLPVLQSLLQHDHAKVRREAILALGRFGTSEASHSLAAVAQSKRSSAEERSLAARAMEAATHSPERH